MRSLDFSIIVILLVIAFAAEYLHQSNTIDRLRSENACLIQSAHIGSAAFATLDKKGHAHAVYRQEDCSK